MTSFRNLIKDFFNPGSAEINIGFLKAKYSDEAKPEVRKILAEVRGRRVLFAKMDHEIWEYVFKSLGELRAMFTSLNGSLVTAASEEIKPSVNFLTDVVSAYLAEYETPYLMFMSGPLYKRMSIPHKERNWPELGQAAEDLIALRQLIFAALANLQAFAEGGPSEEFRVPEHSTANFWVEFARDRTFCKKCGFNMIYAHEARCPSCEPERVAQFPWINGEYGRS